jgi:hypothetical protein
MDIHETERRRMGKGPMVLGAIVLAFALMILTGQRAEAQQLQVGCKYLKELEVDPIFPDSHPHLHQFAGNTGVTATSTLEQMRSTTSTTCGFKADNSGYWTPTLYDNGTERQAYFKVSVYAQDFGNKANTVPFPQALGMLSSKVTGQGTQHFRCGTAPDTLTPPYGCTAPEYRVVYRFPNCWDRSSNAPSSLYMSANGGKAECNAGDASFFNMRLAFHYVNSDRNLEAPLLAAMGAGQRAPVEDVAHADIGAIFTAAWFDRAKICTTNSTPSVDCQITPNGT